MNHIDKMFKHKLEHYNVDVPQGAWDNIASRLPEPRRRFRPWWALMSVFVVIFISGITAFLNSDKCSTGSTVNIYNLSNNNQQHAKNENTLKVRSHPSTLASALVSVTKEENSRNDIFQSKKTKLTDQATNISQLIIAQNISNASIILNDQNKNYQNKSASELSLNTRSVENISYLFNNLKTKKLGFVRNLKMPKPFKKEKEVKACPFVLNTQDKSVDVYFSHDFANKNLTGNSASSSYRDMRMATESPLYSFSVGARFGYNISYRWNLHTGFNYSQINEKFEYIDPESNQTRIITIKDYIYDNGKIIDSVVTQQTVLVPGTTKHEVYNKYKTFDIPVLARYTILANKNLSLSGVAGVFVNIGLSEKGMILDPNNSKPISMSSVDDEGNSIFKTQVGLTIYSSLSLAYHLSQKIDFLFEPNIRLQTGSITNDSYALNQKFNTYGISTGLRYKF